MPDIPIQKFSFFGDESGITNDRFSAVGGTVVLSERLEVVYKRLRTFREKHNMYAELKWSKVSNQKSEAYTELVDLYFDLVGQGYITYIGTMFDNSKWDHRKYNENDPDIGLSKLYYQMLLRQYVGIFGDLATLYICLDRRRSTTSLDDLQRMLNAGASKDYGLSFGPVRVLTSKDSKKDDMIQFSDVILGGMTAHRNGKHLRNETRAAKRDLAKHICARSGLHSFEGEAKTGGFRIWNFKPR